MCEESARRFARAHAGKRFGRLPFAALQRQKAPAARDQKARHLQILGIQEFTWKAEYNAAEFLLRLPLRRRGDQNAGKILELCRCDRLHLRDWAVGGDFNQGGPGCKDQIFVGVGKQAALIVERDLDPILAQHITQLPMAAVRDGDADVGIPRRKGRERAVELSPLHRCAGSRSSNSPPRPWRSSPPRRTCGRSPL